VDGKPFFLNILKFAGWFYNQDHQIEVSQNYPQQNNGYDCGMFLLCGIKDTFRNYNNEWSFSQADMRYKRILFGKEIID
jgi:Ulp1 family protease